MTEPRGNLFFLVNHCREAVDIDKNIARLQKLQPTVDELELYLLRRETADERLWGWLNGDELMSIASFMSITDLLSLLASSRYIRKQLKQMNGFYQLIFNLVSKHCQQKKDTPLFKTTLNDSSTFIQAKLGIPKAYRETVIGLLSVEATTQVQNSIQTLAVYTKGLNFDRMVMVSYC